MQANALEEAKVLAKARASTLLDVTSLNFWGQGLNDVSLVRLMPSLQIVSLTLNSITSLQDFEACTLCITVENYEYHF